MVQGRWLKRNLEALGHWFFYLTMRVFGHRGGYLLLLPVIFCYVLFSRKIHKTVKPYFKRRFPGSGPLQYWICTLKNVYNFGQVLVDRGWLGVNSEAEFQGELVGYDHLLELIEKKKGLVLLTAHVGNWQSALAHLSSLPVKVHALMQYDQHAAAKHYFDIKKDGKKPFEIIDVESPFGGLVDAAAALQRGEVITIMGDRYVKGSFSTVEFLGGSVRIPDAAYILAATAGAPVVVLLSAKTGAKSHQLKVWESFYPSYEDRDKRAEMLQECAQKYLNAIENYLKNYPFQWYNFYDFWEQ